MPSLRFRAPAAVTGAALLALLLGGCQPGAANTPTPAPTPAGTYACPAADWQVETTPLTQDSLNELSESYRVACRNRAKISVWPTKDGESGVQSFGNKLVDAAISDTVLTTTERDRLNRRCDNHPAWELPYAAGAVVVIANLGEQPGALRLSGTTLAKIFSGSISRWDDRAIAAENPDRLLPALPIQIFVRGGNTGATATMSSYLHRAAPEEWLDSNVDRAWRGKGEPRNSPAEVISSVRSTPGALAYVEQPALPTQATGNLTVASIGSADTGVAATRQSIAAQVAQLGFGGSGNDLWLADGPTDGPGYPLVNVHYLVVCSAGLQPERVAVQRDFGTWLLGEDSTESLQRAGMVQLSAAQADRVRRALAAVG
ncbi:substrate-binding domain-containing protein [Granulicoccus phenolivorans]|uniref:substrate-binding domain-containing protein n=1 Tax=Granulicoccus phenolivorans TaxID=266854 RepID=UPI00041F5DB5|nr:substrate-binding domain-containing protein [Granulicoccus phenolivorans]